MDFGTRITDSLILALTLIHTLHADALIIGHGAFGTMAAWLQPGGCFYGAVRKSIAELPSTLKGDHWHLLSFHWRQPFGGLFDVEKIRAAHQLLEQIKLLRTQGHERILVFMHSYGGHVAILAAQLATGTLQLTEALGHDIARNTTTQRHLNQFIATFYHYAQKHQKRSNPEESKPLIDMLYTAGTPHDLLHFWPPFGPHGIGNLINFYSPGDVIQKLAGAQRISNPLPPECCNIEICFMDTKGNLEHPGHTNLHHQAIGTWLLWIPKHLNAIGKHGWQHFAYGTDGCMTLHLGSTQPPQYRPATLSAAHATGVKPLDHQITLRGHPDERLSHAPYPQQRQATLPLQS